MKVKVGVGVRGGSCNGLAVLIAMFNTGPENVENMQAPSHSHSYCHS